MNKRYTENPEIKEIFKRNPEGILEKLQASTVGIAGAGGLGSNVAEFLVRAGIGRLIVDDPDSIELSNLGRQNYFLHQVGMKKVDALKDNLLKINPELRIDSYEVELNEKNISSVFIGCDILIEALDRAEEKEKLLKGFKKYLPHIPVIIASGLGGYGLNDEIKTERVDTYLWIVGDMKRSDKSGLTAPRVAMVAAAQANLAVKLLVDGVEKKFSELPPEFSIVSGG